MTCYMIKCGWQSATHCFLHCSQAVWLPDKSNKAAVRRNVSPDTTWAEGLKITYLLMNSKHTSFPSFDFLQPGTLKFIRLCKLISSVANSFWLIVYIDEDNKQLKFISQSNERAIYAEKLIFYATGSGCSRRCCPCFPLERLLSSLTSLAQVALPTSWHHEMKSQWNKKGGIPFNEKCFGGRGPVKNWSGWLKAV